MKNCPLRRSLKILKPSFRIASLRTVGAFMGLSLGDSFPLCTWDFPHLLWKSISNVSDRQNLQMSGKHLPPLLLSQNWSQPSSEATFHYGSLPLALWHFGSFPLCAAPAYPTSQASSVRSVKSAFSSLQWHQCKVKGEVIWSVSRLVCSN